MDCPQCAISCQALFRHPQSNKVKILAPSRQRYKQIVIDPDSVAFLSEGTDFSFEEPEYPFSASPARMFLL